MNIDHPENARIYVGNTDQIEVKLFSSNGIKLVGIRYRRLRQLASKWSTGSDRCCSGKVNQLEPVGASLTGCATDQQLIISSRQVLHKHTTQRIALIKPAKVDQRAAWAGECPAQRGVNKSIKVNKRLLGQCKVIRIDFSIGCNFSADVCAKYDRISSQRNRRRIAHEFNVQCVGIDLIHFVSYDRFHHQRVRFGLVDLDWRGIGQLSTRGNQAPVATDQAVSRPTEIAGFGETQDDFVTRGCIELIRVGLIDLDKCTVDRCIETDFRCIGKI